MKASASSWGSSRSSRVRIAGSQASPMVTVMPKRHRPRAPPWRSTWTDSWNWVSTVSAYWSRLRPASVM